MSTKMTKEVYAQIMSETCAQIQRDMHEVFQIAADLALAKVKRAYDAALNTDLEFIVLGGENRKESVNIEVTTSGKSLESKLPKRKYRKRAKKDLANGASEAVQ